MEVKQLDSITVHPQRELFGEVTELQKNLYYHTQHLSDQLTKKLHHLEDYNTPIDDEAIKLANAAARYYELLIKSPSIGAVVKEIVSEGHKC